MIYKNARSSTNIQRRQSIEKQDQSEDGNSEQHPNDDADTTLVHENKSKDAMNDNSKFEIGMDQVTDILTHGNITDMDGFYSIKLNNPISQIWAETNLTNTHPVLCAVSSPSATDDRRMLTRFRNDDLSNQASLSPILKRSDAATGEYATKMTTIRFGND